MNRRLISITAMSLVGRLYEDATPDFREIVDAYGGVCEEVPSYSRAISRPDWGVDKDTAIDLARGFHAGNILKADFPEKAKSYRSEDWAAFEHGIKMVCGDVEAILVSTMKKGFKEIRNLKDYRYTILVENPSEVSKIMPLKKALEFAGYDTSIDTFSEKYTWMVEQNHDCAKIPEYI